MALDDLQPFRMRVFLKLAFSASLVALAGICLWFLYTNQSSRISERAGYAAETASIERQAKKQGLPARQFLEGISRSCSRYTTSKAHMSCINSAKYGEFGEVYDSALRWQLTLEWLLAAVHGFFVAVIAGLPPRLWSYGCRSGWLDGYAG